MCRKKNFEQKKEDKKSPLGKWRKTMGFADRFTIVLFAISIEQKVDIILGNLGAKKVDKDQQKMDV